MKILITLTTILATIALGISCTPSKAVSKKKAKTESTKSKSKSKPKPSYSSSSAMARRILKHPKIILLRRQVSGRNDGASAYDNIRSTANGHAAKRSSYKNAPGGYVRLNRRMLATMLYLADKRGYRYRVTSIAGGSHSRNSRHYSGVAFDVDKINGVKVGYGRPYHRAFRNICRSRGATEVLGPGNRGHSTHIHMGWPR